MSKQSLHTFDRDVKLYEGFASAADVVKAGGEIIGAPTFLNGVITLNGSTDAVGIKPPIENDTKGTFIARVRPTTGAPGSDMAIIAFGDTDANEVLSIGMSSANVLVARAKKAGTDQWVVVTDSNPFADATWIIIGVVQDGNFAILYVNGIAVAQILTSGADDGAWLNSLTGLDNGRIGTQNFNSGGDTVFFDGDIDYTTIYSRALSATEMASQFGGRLYTPPPIANQVLDVDPRLGVISDRWKNAITNTAVTVVRDGVRVMDFDGSTSKLALGNIGNIKSMSFWIKLATTTEQILEGTANAKLILASSGTLTYAEFDNAFVNAIDTNTIAANLWRYVVITSTTDVDMSAVTIGLNNVTNGKFRMGPIILYTSELSQEFIERSFLSEKTLFGL